MHPILNRMKQQLESYASWNECKRIVLAISGGVDSMSLLHLMQALLRMEEYQDKELVVAHFNHRLREESIDELQVVKDYCLQEGLTYVFGEWSRPAKRNVEALARAARYAFLADAIDITESDSLMTGHHLDDLAETFMMRIIRGTSLKGLQAIRPFEDRQLTTNLGQGVLTKIIRPLIQIEKAELYNYARELDVPYIDDRTNFEDKYLRNRVRHHLIPQMEEENGQLKRNILDLVKQSQASYETHFTRYQAIEHELIARAHESWVLYVPAFLKFKPSTRRTYLTLFFEERLVHDLKDYNKSLIDELDYMITQSHQPNMQLDLGDGWLAKRQYNLIQIYSPGSIRELNRPLPDVHLTELNQWYQIRPGERVGIFSRIYNATQLVTGMKMEVGLILQPGERILFKLRHRQPGDSIALHSSQGAFHKKIARIMIDDKVPSEQRDQAWLLVNRHDEILAYLPEYKAHHPMVTNRKEASHVFLYQKLEKY